MLATPIKSKLFTTNYCSNPERLKQKGHLVIGVAFLVSGTDGCRTERVS